MSRLNLEPISRVKLHWLLAIIILLVAANAHAQESAGDVRSASGTTGMAAYKWSRQLPADSCPWSDTDTNCHASSPAVADVNGDGHKDVVVATNNGHIVVVNHLGNVLWNKDVAGAFGMAANSQEFHSSPAVADVDGDGNVEIVVGAGTTRANICTQGGVIMLDHRGGVEAGWPQLARDGSVAPDGCRDSIFSSPALGDLDNDGDLEIVAGGFDKRIYAWHHNGTLLPGFPPDSYHLNRFPTWTDLVDRLADTIWSSPALADLDGDGYLDIIIGSDEGNFGPVWTCPYTLPPGWASGYCGGSIYALNRFGQLLPGFPRYIHETVQSSPAVADLNGDGIREIIVGTGSFYFKNSPDHPQNGFRLFVLDNQGRDFPGWEGGKAVGGPVSASPTIGDIAGDGGLEVVVPVMEERKLHAWHANGTRVSGFPMKPLDQFGKSYASFDVGSSTVLADYDGDGKMEILLNQAWVVTVVDGDGTQLTGDNFPYSAEPIYYAEGTLLNNPAVADLDGDGELELVAHNSTLYVWDLPGSRVNEDAWPGFKRDAHGRSYVPAAPRLEPAAGQVLLLSSPGDGGGASGTALQPATIILYNRGDGEITWSATAPDAVTLTTDGGTFSQSQVVEVDLARASYGEGSYDLGDIVITATSDGEPVAGSPLIIPVHLEVADFTPTYLPTVKSP